MRKIKELLKKYLGITMITSAIVGAIVSWGVTWLLPSPDVTAENIPRKELTCTLDYSYSMLIQRVSDSKLQLVYDGEIVQSPFVLEITITNTGEYAISNEDFKDKFSINFTGSDQVVNAQIVKSTDKAISEEVLSNTIVNGTKLIISDFYLNTGEFFTIYVITDGKPDSIDYHSRISGISELIYKNTPKETKDNYLHIMSFVIGISSIISIVLLVWLYRQSQKSKRQYEQFLQIVSKYKQNEK